VEFERLKRLREEFEYSQADVAQAINLTQRSYSYYETGQRMMPPQVLISLACLYRTSADYLLGLTDDPRPYDRKAGRK